MFAGLSLSSAVQVASALYLPDQPVVVAPSSTNSSPILKVARISIAFDHSFALLFTASLLASAAVAVLLMGRSLAIHAHGHPATVITFISAGTAGLGLLTNPLMGALSDRFGRGAILMVAFLANALSLITLAGAQEIGEFMLVMLIFTVAATKDALIPAFITDLVVPERLDGAISTLSAGRWLGNMIGYAAAGYAIHYAGLSTALLMAAILPLLAVCIIAQQRRVIRQRSKQLTHSVAYT